MRGGLNWFTAVSLLLIAFAVLLGLLNTVRSRRS